MVSKRKKNNLIVEDSGDDFSISESDSGVDYSSVDKVKKSPMKKKTTTIEISPGRPKRKNAGSYYSQQSGSDYDSEKEHHFRDRTKTSQSLNIKMPGKGKKVEMANSPFQKGNKSDTKSENVRSSSFTKGKKELINSKQTKGSTGINKSPRKKNLSKKSYSYTSDEEVSSAVDDDYLDTGLDEDMGGEDDIVAEAELEGGLEVEDEDMNGELYDSEDDDIDISEEELNSKYEHRQSGDETSPHTVGKLTRRQRAMLQTSDNELSSASDLLDIDTLYSTKPSRSTLSALERSEKARNRRLHKERELEESKRATIDKLLKKSTSKKSSTLESEDEKEPSENKYKIDSHTIRYIDNANGSFIIFGSSLSQDQILTMIADYS